MFSSQCFSQFPEFIFILLDEFVIVSKVVIKSPILRLILTYKIQSECVDMANQIRFRQLTFLNMLCKVAFTSAVKGDHPGKEKYIRYLEISSLTVTRQPSAMPVKEFRTPSGVYERCNSLLLRKDDHRS